MRLQLVTVGAFFVLSVALFTGDPAYSNPDKEADLLARIQKLEKRIAQLEKTIKKLQASANEPARTQTEAKLLGTWIVADADRKTVSFPDMRFKGDGTCAVVYNPRPGDKNALELQLNAKYRMIGTQLTITTRNITGRYRIVSITNAELVLSWEYKGKVTKMRYTRAK